MLSRLKACNINININSRALGHVAPGVKPGGGAEAHTAPRCVVLEGTCVRGWLESTARPGALTCTLPPCMLSTPGLRLGRLVAVDCPPLDDGRMVGVGADVAVTVVGASDPPACTRMP